MQFFFYGDNNDAEQRALLRRHMLVCGTMLGGDGLGVPRGFGIATIEDKLLLIGYAISHGDEYVQKALITRDKESIRDVGDWFDSHVFESRRVRVLQDWSEEIRLDEELSRILRDKGIPESTISETLSYGLISYDEIESTNI